MSQKVQLSELVPEKTWWVYIVECADLSYYTGITTNIEKRIDKHNTGSGAKYTKFKRPVWLIYFEKYTNRSEATKREMEIKKLTRKQKETLVEKVRKSTLSQT